MRRPAPPASLLFAFTAVLAIGAAPAAGCGGGGETSSTTTTTSSGGAGGSGGSGGAAPQPDVVCVSSPSPAPFAGTDDCPAPAPGTADTLDEALAAGGIDRCHVRLLPDDVALSGWPTEMLFDKHRLPDFTPLHRGPLRLPAYARETRGWLDAAVDSDGPVSG